MAFVIPWVSGPCLRRGSYGVHRTLCNLFWRTPRRSNQFGGSGCHGLSIVDHHHISNIILPGTPPRGLRSRVRWAPPTRAGGIRRGGREPPPERGEYYWTKPVGDGGLLWRTHAMPLSSSFVERSALECLMLPVPSLRCRRWSCLHLGAAD